MNNGWWSKHEEISKLQGYEHPTFKWQLLFKPENTYLDEYLLGSTCWYIALEVAGGIFTCCADRPEDAIQKAIKTAIQEIEETLEWMGETTRSITLKKEELLSLKDKLCKFS